MGTISSFIADFDYGITPFIIGIYFLEVIGEDAASLMEGRIALLDKYGQGIEAQIRRMEKDKIPQIIIFNTKQSLYIVRAQKRGRQAAIMRYLPR